MNNGETYNFRFLDLCAGIGGFHQAMSALGGCCVGASEIDDACIETYRANFPDTPMFGDLASINDPGTLPESEVLCAGFPCQPFSKAGKQLGFSDKTRGQLFFKILDIIDAHSSIEAILLENVRNLADNKTYWERVRFELKRRNFVITEDPLILSPSDFGIPQKRERVFILGIKADRKDSRVFPNSMITEADLDLKKKKCKADAAFSILEKTVDPIYALSSDKEDVLFAWDEFRRETRIKTLGFPIWISHFGIGVDKDSEHFAAMEIDKMPLWKQNYLRRNRHFYHMHREFIDSWVKRHDMFNRSKIMQKFEWNCGEDVTDIKHGLIQIRQSGVRVKRPDLFPTLVAMTNTPIVWDADMGHFRGITPKEAAKLQSFDSDYRFLGSDNQIYKQLGNAVNVEIAKQLGEGLLRLIRKE